MKRGGPLNRYTTLKKGGSLKRTPFKKKPMNILETKRKGTLIKKLWDLFSIHVRTTAADANGMVKCVSCPTVLHWKEMQAGHYLHAPKSNHVSYDTRNVQAQCEQCNCYRDGNPRGYAEALVERHGPEILLALRVIKNASRGLRRHEVEELVLKYGGQNL